MRIENISGKKGPEDWATIESSLATAVDVGVLVFLVSVASFFFYRFLDLRAYPTEDAAILLRYAQNIANGYGIVWNPGGPPVDGGTDFLSMMLIAALMKFGFTAQSAAQSIGLVSHLMTAGIIFSAVIRYSGMPLWVALICSGYFLVGPNLVLVSASFMTPLFVMFSAATWYFALALLLTRRSLQAEILFSVSALATGLTRPEGVFLSAFVLVAIVYFRGAKASMRLSVIFGGMFLAVGGAFLIWRWHYFGQLFPNPYYKKGGLALFPDGLRESLRNVAIMCAPVSPAFIVGLRKELTRARVVAVSIPIVLFTLLWVLISNDMNFVMRYQLAVLPIALMSWPLFIGSLSSELNMRALTLDRSMRYVTFALGILLTFSIFAWMYRIDSRGTRGDDDKLMVAAALSAYDHRYTLVTTEAGLLPFYSQWNSIDAWGLNDSWIAHHRLTAQYLDSESAEVIAVHEPYEPAENGWDLAPQWTQMVNVLNAYVRQRHYVLAAAIGSSPFDLMKYYVKPGTRDTDAIVASIKAAAAQAIAGKAEVDFATCCRPVVQ